MFDTPESLELVVNAFQTKASYDLFPRGQLA